MHIPSFSKQIDINQYISKLNSDSVIPNLIECGNNKFSTFLNFKLKLKELREVINSSKSKSSPSPYLINYQLLKLIPDPGLNKLLEIILK